MWALVSRSTSLSWPRRACIVAEYRKLCLLCLFLAADADVPLLASEPVLLRRWAVATMLAGRMWGESYPPEVLLSDAQRVRHASSYRMRTSMQGAVHSAPLWVSVSVSCKGHAFGRSKSCCLCGMSVLREATMGRSNTLHEGERKGEAITRKQSGRTCKGIGEPWSPFPTVLLYGLILSRLLFPIYEEAVGSERSLIKMGA